jgi:protein-tyrosine sulfotransferase
MSLTGESQREPIFIHGILPRSGTNYLCDLLLLHPDCGRGRDPVREDLFLDHSDHLVAFARDARNAWDPRWGSFAGDLPERLCESIGEGLVSFLWTDRSRRLVTKSPSVRHLERFFTFYPRVRLLVLVRDGRSVVYSGMATFGWDFDRGCRLWSQAADTIRQFQREEAGRGDRWRLVRYEDLLDDTEGQLRSIFNFLGLDPAAYDFRAAQELPVRGSSTFGRDGRNVHWELVAKDESFAPKERWRTWSAAERERFEWLAGEQMRELGYATETDSGSVTHATKQVLLDWQWRITRQIRLGLFHARVRLGKASRPLRRRLGLLRA